MIGPRRLPLCALVASVLLGAGCSGTSGESSDRLDADTSEMAAEDSSCDPELVGEGVGPIESLHRIVHGRLGELCHGVSDPVVAAAWEAVVEVAPAAMLDDLTLFGGYRGTGDTMALAGPVGGDNTRFVIAIDTRTVAENWQQLRMTLVHELAHVITQTPDQLDVEIQPDDCETLWNGLGCYRPDSYLAGWIERFWSSEALTSLPADGSIDEAGGVERCTVDERFIGSYAASHPEEDFAETFAAWVHSVEVADAIKPKFEYLTAFPELVSVRDRAVDAGLVGLADNFDRCG